MEKKEYKLEDYRILDDGIWISRKELERLHEAYDTYKSDMAALQLSHLIYLIKQG